MGGGDSQLFGVGMLVIPLRGKNSRIWYRLGNFDICIVTMVPSSFIKLNEMLSACTLLDGTCTS